MGDSCGVAVSAGVLTPRITFSANTIYHERRAGIQSANPSPPLRSARSSGRSSPIDSSLASPAKTHFGLLQKASTFSEFDRSSPKVRKVRSASKLASSFFRKQASIFPSFGRNNSNSSSASGSNPNSSNPSSSDESKKDKKKKKMKKAEKGAKGGAEMAEKRVHSDEEKPAKKGTVSGTATPRRPGSSLTGIANSPAPRSGVASPKSSESPVKRVRSQVNTKTLARNFQQCEVTDLVVLVADMLGEIVRLNDDIPLTGRGLTRFHSRAPPMISIGDYLQRLALHLNLQPSILLAMVYYIDILSKHYPPFTVSSLTVHRFLITAATVATKGLCDSFLTNSFYARVGGISLMELNLLELEFLVRVGWRIVPKAELLNDYYTSLVGRMPERYQIGGAAVGPIPHGPSTSPDTLAVFDETAVVVEAEDDMAGQAEVKDEAVTNAIAAEVTDALANQALDASVPPSAEIEPTASA